MLLNTRTIIGTIAYLGGIPAVLEPFAWAWSQMIEFNRDYLVDATTQIFYTRATLSDHAAARNMLAASMRGEWLLMLDTDHEFEPDLAARLVRELRESDLDVLSGLYHFKHPPYLPVWFMRQPGGGLGYLGDWERLDGRYLTRLDGAGGGCLLVHRRVFDRIRRELDEAPFTQRNGMSEDLSFFDRCRELEITVYGAPHIESPHLTARPIRLDDYQPDPAALGPRIPVGG